MEIWRRLSQSGIYDTYEIRSAKYNLIGDGIIIARMHHAIIGSRLAAKGEWGLRNAFIDDAVGKHGLGGDSEDEPVVCIYHQ